MTEQYTWTDDMDDASKWTPGKADAPPYPEDAEAFVVVGGKHHYTLSEDDETPEDGVIKTRVASGEEGVQRVAKFSPGDAIPASLVTEATWNGAFDQLAPVDADGELVSNVERRRLTPRERAVADFRDRVSGGE